MGVASANGEPRDPGGANETPADVSQEPGGSSAEAQTGGATEQVLALFDGHRLSPTQRRIAQYLLDHLPDAAFLTSVALAKRVGVSQPSVTRFATALGFGGFPELRDALRPIALRTLAEGHPETPAEVRRNEFQAAIAAEHANLEALHRQLDDPSRLADLGRDLAASTPLVVLGQRVSAALASYFGYAAQRIHPDVRLITRGGSAALDSLVAAREAGAGWLLAFAMPRYATETVEALRAARDLGLRTAVVSDVPLLPFADEVDVVLPAPVGSRLVFDCHASPMVLATLLLQAMADAAPERTQARLEAHESFSEGHHFYVT